MVVSGGTDPAAGYERVASPVGIFRRSFMSFRDPNLLNGSWASGMVESTRGPGEIGIEEIKGYVRQFTPLIPRPNA